MIDVVGEDGDRLASAVQYAAKKGLRKVGFDITRESYLSGKFLLQNGCKEAPGLIAQMRRQKHAGGFPVLFLRNYRRTEGHPPGG